MVGCALLTLGWPCLPMVGTLQWYQHPHVQHIPAAFSIFLEFTPY